VRREITRRGRQKPCLRIVRGLFAALADPARRARAGAAAAGRLAARQDRLADTEQRMAAVLDELGLSALVTSITGLSAVGVAAILAETGDPRRFATARALVKHAGLAPREKLSGAFTGRTRLTGQGRPGLRVAAWRAVWGAQRANPVYGARYQYLTSREHNKLTPTQAQTVIAAATELSAEQGHARIRAPLLGWTIIWAGISLQALITGNSPEGLELMFVLAVGSYAVAAHNSLRRALAGPANAVLIKLTDHTATAVLATPITARLRSSTRERPTAFMTQKGTPPPGASALAARLPRFILATDPVRSRGRRRPGG
jgi:Transposase IS116/IS110/IS902 family